MVELFLCDLKDYNPEGKVYTRPSCKAIIEKDGKLLLIYSKKYNYYMFPGGGMKDGEAKEDALIREVMEETGLVVKRESIEEYGYALTRKKDSIDENGIFEQPHYYFFVQTEEETVPRKLEAYEEEEGFTPVWIEPMVASSHNRHNRNNGADPVWVKREETVLDKVDLCIRERKKEIHHRETIEALGDPKYGEMLEFVKERLSDANTEHIGSKVEISYSRYEHTERVLKWALRLYRECSDKSIVDYDAVVTAVIFHDVGRHSGQKEKIPHALLGVPITREYLLSHGYSEERAEYISGLVGAHSDTYKMTDPSIDRNLLMLMEADLLDDSGALGIVMDCMITAIRNPKARFTDSLDHIYRYTARIQKKTKFVTPEATRIWDEKTRIVEEFAASLKEDTVF